MQGGAASVISGNKVFRMQVGAGGGSYVFIAIPQVNYGTGVANVTGNVIRGRNAGREIGLWYAVDPGAGLSVLSSGNHEQSVNTSRLVDERAVLTVEQ